jgi:hypothetical protein
MLYGKFTSFFPVSTSLNKSKVVSLENIPLNIFLPGRKKKKKNISIAIIYYIFFTL